MQCGKRDLLVGVWLVVKHEGTVYENLIAMHYVGCKPDHDYKG